MNVMDALKISCSIPILFTKVIYNNNEYTDGCVMDAFPYNYMINNFEELNEENIFGIYVKNKTKKSENLFEFIINIHYAMIYKNELNHNKNVHIIELNDEFNMMDYNVRELEILYEQGDNWFKENLNKNDNESSSE